MTDAWSTNHKMQVPAFITDLAPANGVPGAPTTASNTDHLFSSAYSKLPNGQTL